MKQVRAYFIPDNNDYNSLARSMGVAGESPIPRLGIELTERLGRPGGFKEVYLGVYGNQDLAVIVFRYYGRDEIGGPVELDVNKNPDWALAEKLRNKEWSNLKTVEGVHPRCAPKPFAKGNVQFADNMGSFFPAIAEEYIYDESLDKVFMTGGLGNVGPSGNVTDLSSFDAAAVGSRLAEAATWVQCIGPHRDLKPSNFAYGRSGRVTLLDWGTLGRVVSNESRSTATTVYESQEFTAPERNPLAALYLYDDEKTSDYGHSDKLDVYSLGITMAYLRLWHMLEYHNGSTGLKDSRYGKGFRAAVIPSERWCVGGIRPEFDLVDALTVLGFEPSETDKQFSKIVRSCTLPHPSERPSLPALAEELRMLTRRTAIFDSGESEDTTIHRVLIPSGSATKPIDEKPRIESASNSVEQSSSEQVDGRLAPPSDTSTAPRSDDEATIPLTIQDQSTDDSLHLPYGLDISPEEMLAELEEYESKRNSVGIASPKNGLSSLGDYELNAMIRTKYDSIEDALEDAHDGDTIVLFKDYVLSETLTVEKPVTFDLRNKNLLFKPNRESLKKEGYVVAFDIRGCVVSINHGYLMYDSDFVDSENCHADNRFFLVTVDGEGSAVRFGDYFFSYARGYRHHLAKATHGGAIIVNGATLLSDSSACLSALSGGRIEMNSGLVASDSSVAITSDRSSSITIERGRVLSKSVGQPAILAGGPEKTSNQGIDGSIVICGGEIRAKAKSAIVLRDGVDARIYGGTVLGETDSFPVQIDSTAQLRIWGGVWFSGRVPKKYCAPGAAPIETPAPSDAPPEAVGLYGVWDLDYGPFSWM